MKCVKGPDGTVKRVSDEEAHKLVSVSKYKYVAKEVWRKFNNPTEEAPKKRGGKKK